jgi:hypothetical protein
VHAPLLEKVKRIVEREVALLKAFVTTPKGVFETIDEAIKIVREELGLVKKIARS